MILDLLKNNKIYNYIIEQHSNKKDFLCITNSSFHRKENDIKLIAFYLPQFHSIKINDKAHGKGFTDWLNAAKAVPQFEGHHQPHLPIDVGFYDLAHDDIMYRQIELAKMYGIYGFCFHYYWFSGKRLLEKPIFNYLRNKELDLPFCFCWANENWSKLWDGGNKEVIMQQDLKEDDAKKFFEDIIMFFKDERYIKINNKPILIIYKMEIFEKPKLFQFIKYIREEIKKYGFDDIYLLTTNSFIYNPNRPIEAKEIGIDATIEFPPHGLNLSKTIKTQSPNKNFNGIIFDMKKIINEKLFRTNAKYKCVFPSWDNSSRKCNTGCMIMQTDVEDYKKWLEDCINETKKNNLQDEQYVFINAWNEWAEGAHLEPDTKYGYTYLQATKDVLENKARNANI